MMNRAANATASPSHSNRVYTISLNNSHYHRVNNSINVGLQRETKLHPEPKKSIMVIASFILHEKRPIMTTPVAADRPAIT